MIDESLWNKGIGYISYKWFRNFKVLTNFRSGVKTGEGFKYNVGLSMPGAG